MMLLPRAVLGDGSDKSPRIGRPMRGPIPAPPPVPHAFFSNTVNITDL